MQPAHQLAQLIARQRSLLARLVEQGGRGVGLLAEPALGHRQHVAQGHEPLLGAVVQVAPDAPALLVGRLDDAHARGRVSASRARRTTSWRRRSISAAARAPKIESAARSSTLGSRRRRDCTPM